MRSLDPDAIAFADIHHLTDAYRTGELTPTQVVEVMLARIERLDHRLHAYLDTDAEAARDDAEVSTRRWSAGRPLGPLDGVPWAVKEAIPTAGFRSVRGSAGTGAGVVASADAPVVARCREAGAVLLGTTRMCELGWFCASIASAYEATRNPWDLSRTPGGSSGGAAAAVAAGLCTFAVGSDQGGSIRNPAAWCGIVGLKPTNGVVPQLPDEGLWILTHGCLTRSVRDAGLVLHAMCRPDSRAEAPAGPVTLPDHPPHLGGRRVAVWRDPPFGLPNHPEVAAALDRCVAALADLGAGLVDDHPDLGNEDPWLMIDDVGAATAHGVASEPDFDIDAAHPAFQQLAVRGAAIALDDARMVRLAEGEQWLRERFQTFFERHDLLLTATAPIPPFAVERPWASGAALTPSGITTEHFALLGPMNRVAVPAISVPAGTAEELPVGVQLVAPVGADGALLDAANLLAAALPDLRHPLMGTSDHARALDVL